MFFGGILHFLRCWKQSCPAVSPYYLTEVKPHKTTHYEVSRHSIVFINV